MSRSDTGRNGLYVVPAPGGWAIKKTGSAGATKVYRTQAEATRAAKEQLRNNGGELRIQGKNGKWRESFTIGFEAISKFNAIEGVHLSPEMKGVFRDFDREGLSPEERRAAIERKFAKKG